MLTGLVRVRQVTYTSRVKPNNNKIAYHLSTCLVAISSLLCLLLPSSQSMANDVSIAFKDCQLSAFHKLQTVRAQCGYIEVPLDYAQADADSIRLEIARIPSLSSQPAQSPLTIIQGGPGGASLQLYTQHANAFRYILQNRDIILLDQRGTGKSAPLACPQLDESSLSLSDWSVAKVQQDTKACLAELPYDPRYFTTSNAVRDLDTLRAALGYKQLNLYGVSYGTRVALHYLRRFPQNTRSVIVDAVVPPDFVLGPDVALQAQNALESLFERCQQDHACNTQFPELAQTFDKLLGRLQQQAVNVSLLDPKTTQLSEEVLTDLELKGLVRMLMYKPETLSVLPLMIHQAYHEAYYTAFKSLAANMQSTISEQISSGMHNAVVCTEDIPFLETVDIDRKALEQTYLGTLALDHLVAVCEVWPRGIIDDDFKQPLVSTKPVLILSGSTDPITPPIYGEQIKRHLTNALHIVGQGMGHGLFDKGCMPLIMKQFIDEATTKNIDASCLQRQQAEPFFLSPSGPAP